ncbi:hypothetical protein EMIHUDRAFT_468817 [Emiliania huxleyi CCMP1516]|uniref:sphingolipid C(9)-methyltransferase n=2 Tax=Emiliania huxleyi TaxID=2903 RepID=A0A0D3JVM8_EMIH1|nr:hypothetical protein EMIHUDRAFT_468817 [Emiliania huxleyi CCMP1516]EOD27563.1 hypothetical protein EMIHUDRAFT_468817 [Emiliania huxleyi CCMP1516]|eukprot:XP_005779992.1 hypothetical protein EMIHUDRAFT_468817 [Emiliania huxleyi CCMP1516]
MVLEKIYVGVTMANKWTDPTSLLIIGLAGGVPALLIAEARSSLATVAIALKVGLVYTAVLPGLIWLWYQFHLRTPPADTEAFLTFKDASLRRSWAKNKIPMHILVEAFLDDKVAFKKDVFKTLDEHREDFIDWRPTWNLALFLIRQVTLTLTLTLTLTPPGTSPSSSSGRLANFTQPFLSSIFKMLKDDGLFFMQARGAKCLLPPSHEVAGLRKGSNWQDVQWGLFMSKYIFPGADASTPLYWYTQQLEKAGFEVHSVENIGRHYSHTLKAWYDNFQKNKSKPEIQQYPARLHRLWDIFLAWSVVAAGQGSATCYQIVSHKNLYSFPRDNFCSDQIARPTGPRA